MPNHEIELKDILEVDHLIDEGERCIATLERTIREASRARRNTATAGDLLADMRLTQVRFKAHRAAVLQLIHDDDSGQERPTTPDIACEQTTGPSAEREMR
jgi:hypothetical protein